MNPIRGLGQPNFDLSCKGLPIELHLSSPTSSLFTTTSYLPKIGTIF